MSVTLLLTFAGSAAAFHNAPVVQRTRRTASVVMGDPIKPTDFPVKNVWTTVCSKADLKPSSLKAAFGAGQDILIATDKGGKVFASANVCPHIGTPLDQGTVEDGAIICPLHRSAFDLRTGKLVGPWCPAPPLIGPLTGKLKSPKELKTFQARTQGGSVQVLLDVNAKKRFDSNYWRGILDAQGKVDGSYY
jgi:nitrite reductase/ring-hydroxylating ferredoxin subunit